MSAKNFGKLREQLEQRPGGVQALERARQSLGAEIAAYEAGLAELRRALHLTQTQLARQLNVTQSEVSRIERRADLYLSTLQSYIEAMGGELELVGIFDDERVRLAIGELVPPARDDAEGQDTDSPTVRTWDVTARLEYRGDPTDPVMDRVRDEILTNVWVTSDGVAIRRGRYSDEVNVDFEIEADDEGEAQRRASAALNRAVRNVVGVRHGGGLSVELAAGVG
jgi:transcriptional regulator with XRE-family HTH domain